MFLRFTVKKKDTNDLLNYRALEEELLVENASNIRPRKTSDASTEPVGLHRKREYCLQGLLFMSVLCDLNTERAPLLFITAATKHIISIA